MGDGVANVVDRLRERGFDPRRVGDDLWEARCPAHRGPDHALAVSRNEFNHVLLECRAAERCRYARIVSALGFTNDLLYEDTPDWLVGRLKRVPIQTSLFPRRMWRFHHLSVSRRPDHTPRTRQAPT